MRRAAFAALALLSTQMGAARAADEEAVSRAVKATYLYKLAPFISWPEDAFAEGEAFRLCIAGRDPFGALIDDAVRGQVINGRMIRIVRLETASREARCHMAYVAGAPEQDVPHMLAAFANKTVLTVTDSETGSDGRGVIHFVRRANTIRFRIDLKSARTHGLTVSSKLLSLAVAVDGERDNEDVRKKESLP